MFVRPGGGRELIAALADPGQEALVQPPLLAEVDGHPVAVRQGNVLAVSFHPELGDERRLHERFLERVRERRDEFSASARSPEHQP